MQTLHDFVYDLRFAVRTLRKSAAAAATIVLCLGLSIGATGTVFAWMNSVTFRPLPAVDDLERLVSLKTTMAGDEMMNVSYPDYRDVVDADRASARTFIGLAASNIRQLNLRTDASAEARLDEPLWGALTSASYFDVLHVRPVVGRGFLAGDDSVVGGAAVVVISHALWQRRFSGDRGVLGRRVWVNGRGMEIVGVAPPGFYGTISRLALDLWIPLTMHAEVGGYSGIYDERGVRWLAVFGRLAPGASLATARAAAQATGEALAATYAEDKDLGLTARELDVGPVDRLVPIVSVMLAITVLVMLIVCSNVANLLLQRGDAREHEMAVRVAIGAHPSRLVRQLMTESLLLACGGVLVGGAMLALGRNVLSAVAPVSPLPIVANTAIDTRVGFVVAAIGISTVFAFGLVPALRAARVAVRASLAGAGATRGGSAASGRLRGALVGGQFALALAVLITAGLFLQRLDELRRVDRGFRDPAQVMLGTVNFTLSGVREASMPTVLTERMVERISVLPGVRAAAAASFVPLGLLGYEVMGTSVDGYTPRPGEETRFLINRVSAGYFATMGIPIVRGRAIASADRDGARPVAVVNEAFARRFWGSNDPIDRRIRVDGRELTVVGVAADGKYYFLAPLDAASPPFVYLPFAQWGHFEVVLHVRAAGDPLAMASTVQQTVAAVDGRLSVMSPSTLDAYSAVPYLPIRLGSSVLSLLGAAALVLATFGLYAVTAYAVTERRREIGIRMALGATPARVVAHVVAQAARYTTLGALVGLVLAVLITRGLAASLPDTLPRATGDRVWPFAAALAMLAAVAMLAALVPANRAARVSPTVSLREE